MVTVDSGTAAAPSSVDTISGKTVTMTLAAAVTSGQTVTVDYTVPTSNPLQDESELEAPAFTGQAVTNNTGTNNAAMGQPGIMGAPQSGQQLTATLGSITDMDGQTSRTFPDDWTTGRLHLQVASGRHGDRRRDRCDPRRERHSRRRKAHPMTPVSGDPGGTSRWSSSSTTSAATASARWRR